MVEYIGKQKILNDKIEMTIKGAWAVAVLTDTDGIFTEAEIAEAKKIKLELKAVYEQYYGSEVQDEL